MIQKNIEKKVFQPYGLTHLPVNLWGQNVFQGMGSMLTTNPIQKNND